MTTDSSSSSAAATGELISQIIGWTYAFCWSFSFYPQWFLILRRRSSQGLSFDFAFMNVYNVSLFWSETVRQTYRERNNGQNPLVDLNDVAFSVHAFTITSITLATALYYRDRKLEHASMVVQSLMILSGVVGTALLIVYLTQWLPVQALDIIYFLSYCKLLSTILKCVPQVYLNYTRKSTTGWSITNVFMDVTGGVLSISQLFLDASLQNNWSGITGHLSKLFLGLLSLGFDVVFLLQHFVWFRNPIDYAFLRSSDEESLIPDIPNDKKP